MNFQKFSKNVQKWPRLRNWGFLNFFLSLNRISKTGRFKVVLQAFPDFGCRRRKHNSEHFQYFRIVNFQYFSTVINFSIVDF